MNFLIKKLEAAWNSRAELLASQPQAYRLLTGAYEGVPGLIIEKYGPVLLFQIWPEDFRFNEEEIQEAALWCLDKSGASSLYRKVLEKDRSGKPPHEKLGEQKPFLGEPSPEAVILSENGVKYEVRPFSSYMTGLFLDQRENRRRVAELAAGNKLLNLFSYTCSFSIAAAVHGEAETTNIDLSTKYLNWGKRNFAHNRVSLANHRFFSDDARDFLRKAQKRGEKFSVVVLDPPSFSRNQKKVFRLEEEAGELIRASSQVVAEQGYLFVSCNFSGWNDEAFGRITNGCLPSNHWQRLSQIRKPVDFEADRLMKSALFVKRG